MYHLEYFTRNQSYDENFLYKLMLVVLTTANQNAHNHGLVVDSVSKIEKTLKNLLSNAYSDEVYGL